MANTLIRMKQRSDTTTDWESADPVLLEGEVGYDSTAERIKVGDGVSSWSELDYWNLTLADIGPAVADVIPDSAVQDALREDFAPLANPTKHAPAFGLFFPEAEGAIEGGVIDASDAFAAARAAAGDAVVWVNAGTWRCDDLAITGTHARFRGTGPGLSVLTTSTGRLIALQGSYHQFEDLHLKSDTGGGHIFEQTASVDRLHLKNVWLTQVNLDKQVYRAVNFGYVECVVEACNIFSPGAATVPGWFMQSNGGNLNNNQWVRSRWTCTGAAAGHTAIPCIYIESTSPAGPSVNYATDNVFLDVNFEVPVGGCLELRGCHKTTIRITAWDTLGTPAKNHHILLGAGSGGAESRYAHVTFGRRAGSLAKTAVGTGLALSASADTVSATAHGLANGTPVVLSSIVTSTGVYAETTYYVLNAATNTFQLALTPGGAVIDIGTADGNATVTANQVYDIKVETAIAGLSTFHQIVNSEDATNSSFALDAGQARFMVFGRRPATAANVGGVSVLSALSGAVLTSASPETPLTVRAAPAQSVNVVRVTDENLTDHFTIDPVGRTTVGRSGPISGALLTVLSPDTSTIAAIISASAGSTVDCFRVRKAGAVDYFTVGSTGVATFSTQVTIGGALSHSGSAAGFYGATPVPKPTGVTVDAAGIHAALVSLGLIAA